ncbi:MAG TPA: Hpt domain-containing protein [Humidesulfovibrio sp.]|uniref:Hpt domain-containing protein n=1 Tax=Humidesulfovibrio sp. TaxID=2910988 RepID=UPI002CB30FD8|nr:Hpt domain-containing protein [Humidesulfovibrio sp.]HWR03971.1 Hpt domain-containing protein [Humidesulfovibrio sp.]
MMGDESASGINLVNLREAFEGSEDVLAQMLGLFLVQAAERVEQLNAHLGGWDSMGARTALHSLVNISGAVRAYAMSELAKAVGDAVKRDDRGQALAAARALSREADTVLSQARILLEAAKDDPRNLWNAPLPGLGGVVSPS